MESMEKKYLREINRNEQGMTLVEIIAVLTIIVVIMTLVGQQVTRQLQKGKVLSAKTQIKLIEQGLEDYYRENDAYPTTEQGLDALFKKPSSGRDTPSWAGPYLKGSEAPKDPWRYDYQYISEDGQKYLLFSFGRDGKEGGEDVNADITNESR